MDAFAGTGPAVRSGSRRERGPEQLAREGYAAYGGELYRYALSRLRDDGAAQDVVQETIVRAWRAADRFDPEQGSLRTWLFAIARRVVIDQAAAAGRRPRPVDTGEDPTGAGGAVGTATGQWPDHVGVVVDRDLVTRALGLVSHDHRTALVETFLRDRSYEDVAAELGVPVSTLRSRVFHGLRQLRRAVELQREVEEGVGA